MAFEQNYKLNNHQNLTVRTPNAEDAEKLIEYMKKIDKQTKFLAREPGEFSLTIEQERDFLAGLSDSQFSRMYIAEIKGEIVANCSIGVVNKFSRFKHRASIGIAVEQSSWRLGIGRILIGECIAWSRNNAIEQIELDVVTENARAIALYEKLGFKVFGTKKNALKYNDGTYADEYYMILML